MIGLQVKNIKDFMNHLFVRDSFDWMDLVEVVIVKDYMLTIEGKRQLPYKRKQEEGEGSEEKAEKKETEYLSYREMRPLLLTHIRGKETPQLIRMTLALSAEKFAGMTGNAFEAEGSQIDRFLLNIRFGSQGLSLVTGVSYRSFSMEKEAERCWDQYLKLFLTKKEIDFEE